MMARPPTASALGPSAASADHRAPRGLRRRHLGKMHAIGHTLFAFCADCAALYRKDRMGENPPSSWTVDLATLIAERGATAR
jgi:hypothetical protein